VEYSGPIRLLTNSSGCFYILAAWDSIKKYNDKFQYLEKTEKTYAYSMALSDKWLVTVEERDGKQIVVYYRIDGSKIGNRNMGDLEGINGRVQTFIIENDYLFCVAFSTPIIYKLSDEGISVLKYATDDWNSQDSNYYVKNGKIFNLENGYCGSDAEGYFVAVGKNGLQFGMNGKINDAHNIGRGTVFGVDDVGNRYLIADEARIAVVARNGDILKEYDIRNSIGKNTRICIPCIDGIGNIYYIESTDSGHKVIKIARKW
jgi:hypothetical protein